MNKGGTDGTVVSVTSTSTGDNVKVHFPGDPSAQPPVPPYDEEYNPCPPWAVKRFDSTNELRPRVDVVVGDDGMPVLVKVHA